MDLYGKCPKCGADWLGGNIPKVERKHFSPPYKWSRVIGVEDGAIYDGVAWWKCPDCLWGFSAIPSVEDKQF
jgi:hypothetical protein